MWRHTKLILLFLAIFMTIYPGQSMAENKAGSMGLTFFFGGYTFDPDQDLDSELTVGIGLGYNINENLGIEAMFNTMDTEDDLRFDASALVYHIDGLYHFTPEKKLVPYLAAGIGAISIDYDSFLHSNDTDILMNYGAGLKYFVGESVALRADVRHIVSFGKTNHNLRYTLGLLFPFGGGAQRAEGREHAVLSETDSDGDGVPDKNDKCPDTPKNVSVDRSGCPLDSDGDGVPDYLDKCPATPAGAAVSKSGCPKDSDGDGVLDYLDKCPDTPAGTPVDKNGCASAESMGAEVTERGTYVFRNIQFDVGKATIKTDSYPVLDNVARFLEDKPDMNIEIQGHTDSTGPVNVNNALSESRARAVLDYLVSKGIAPERLTSKGYGSSMPVADNDTREGRTLNRRVEFAPVNR
ncbi:MAG: OmpA family protein [Deltaproteobacteria bacterium]|nr:OmpA family protein [Deltaproteobacteria bacterium]